MKNVIIIGGILIIISLLFVFVPGMNCFINSNLSCFHNYNERHEIEKRYAISEEDISSNRETYEGIIQLMLTNGYDSLERRVSDKRVFYTISGNLSTEDGSSVEYILPNNLEVHGLSIVEAFNHLGLTSITKGVDEIRLDKEPTSLNRGFVEYYTYDEKDHNHVAQGNKGGGGKVIYESNKNFKKRTVVIDEHWTIVTIEHNSKIN